MQNGFETSVTSGIYSVHAHTTDKTDVTPSQKVYGYINFENGSLKVSVTPDTEAPQRSSAGQYIFERIVVVYDAAKLDKLSETTRYLHDYRFTIKNVASGKYLAVDKSAHQFADIVEGDSPNDADMHDPTVTWTEQGTKTLLLYNASATGVNIALTDLTYAPGSVTAIECDRGVM